MQACLLQVPENVVNSEYCRTGTNKNATLELLGVAGDVTKALRSIEMSVTIYHPTRLNIADDLNSKMHSLSNQSGMNGKCFTSECYEYVSPTAATKRED